MVQLPHRVRIQGTAAWLAWLALHLIALLGGRNRLSALVNLSCRYLTRRRGGGGIIGDHPPGSPLDSPASQPTIGSAGTN